MSRFVQMMRRGFQFWLESLGRYPGLTRDAGLTVAAAAPALAEGPGPAAAPLDLCAMSAEARALAGELVWGWALRFDSLPSCIRVTM